MKSRLNISEPTTIHILARLAVNAIRANSWVTRNFPSSSVGSLTREIEAKIYSRKPDKEITDLFSTQLSSISPGAQEFQKYAKQFNARVQNLKEGYSRLSVGIWNEISDCLDQRSLMRTLSTSSRIYSLFSKKLEKRFGPRRDYFNTDGFSFLSPIHGFSFLSSIHLKRSSQVTAIEMSTHHTLGIGYADGTIEFRDGITREIRTTIHQHIRGVKQIKFYPDRNFWISLSVDNMLFLWREDKLIYTLEEKIVRAAKEIQLLENSEIVVKHENRFDIYAVSTEDYFSINYRHSCRHKSISSPGDIFLQSLFDQKGYIVCRKNSRNAIEVSVLNRSASTFQRKILGISREDIDQISVIDSKNIVCGHYFNGCYLVSRCAINQDILLNAYQSRSDIKTLPYEYKMMGYVNAKYHYPIPEYSVELSFYKSLGPLKIPSARSIKFKLENRMEQISSLANGNIALFNSTSNDVIIINVPNQESKLELEPELGMPRLRKL